MPSIATTLRYRTFPNNKPTPANGTPRGTALLAPFEKEPVRNPDADCFMCRQAHVYVKPIGMQQELRVAGDRPPPLTRDEIDELSQKKQLTKKEVRKLLQCYFPEIKDVKYFQLHRYHSCCYDPKHLNLCKNHITALQTEREKNPGHHHGDEGDNSYDKQNRVSFVRIKIEPMKGIPTRFLGPAALPEPLADMLIKQVNRFEKKKRAQSVASDHASQSHSTRQVINTYGLNGNDYDDNAIIDDRDYDSDENQASSKLLATNGSMKKNGTGRKKNKLKHWEILALQQSKKETCSCRHHVTRVEDDQLVYDWCRCKDHHHKDIMERRQSIELGEPSPREVRLAVDQVAYNWCKCKNHRHTKVTERSKSITLPAVSHRETHFVNGQDGHNTCQCQDHRHKVSVRKRKTKSPIPPPAREETKHTMLSTSQRTESIHTTPLPLTQVVRRKRRGESKNSFLSVTQQEEPIRITPPPPASVHVERRKWRDDSKHHISSMSYREEASQTTPPRSQTHIKRRETHTRTVGMEARGPSSMEVALAYDPAEDDFEIIQEAIYYRTSSGRLIKPQMTQSFTYDNALSSMPATHQGSKSNREPTVYMTRNGPIPEDVEPRRKKNIERSPSRSVILSNPGSVYRGQAYIDPEYSQPHNDHSNTIPLLKLPSIPTASRQQYNDNPNEHQPAEFTLAKFANDAGEQLPTQRTQGSSSTGGWKTVQMSMQTSTKPTFTNSEPTPNFGPQSSVVANRRWFDQPLGDQNLRPVHDSEHGIIAAPSSDANHNKSHTEPAAAAAAGKKENNCTIS